jgi:hypothetical protein
MAMADPFDGFLEILAIPFQIGSQRFIECDGRILTTPLSVLILALCVRVSGVPFHGCLSTTLLALSF